MARPRGQNDDIAGPDIDLLAPARVIRAATHQDGRFALEDTCHVSISFATLPHRSD
jgi:hypothetical protein